jgi:hypothetical protein
MTSAVGSGREAPISYQQLRIAARGRRRELCKAIGVAEAAA